MHIVLMIAPPGYRHPAPIMQLRPLPLGRTLALFGPVQNSIFPLYSLDVFKVAKCVAMLETVGWSKASVGETSMSKTSAMDC